jgi:hypothetical protein
VRRVIVLSVTAATALFISGCGATSDSDIVARVDDTELDRETFTQLVNEREASNGSPVDSQPSADAARTDGDTARDVAGQFITLELVRKDLEAMGTPVPEVDAGLTGTARFDQEYQTIGSAWATQGSDVLGSEALKNWYDQGPTESGVACVQHILVADEPTAQTVLDRLDGGEAFGDVAADASLDTQSAAQGGSVGCQPLSAFTDTFIPEFVDGSLGAEVGVPTQPVESRFGQHVIRVMPFEELTDQDMILTRLIALGQWHDVETDPEIGTWEWINVTPLG